MIAAIACLALLQPYEGEIRAALPGNASEFRFEDCQIQDQAINVQSRAKLQQRVCKWGRCVTAWSYSSTVYGQAVVDDSCNLVDVRIWSVPRQPLLEPLIPLAIKGIRNRWPEVRERHADLCP